MVTSSHTARSQSINPPTGRTRNVAAHTRRQRSPDTAQRPHGEEGRDVNSVIWYFDMDVLGDLIPFDSRYLGEG